MVLSTGASRWALRTILPIPPIRCLNGRSPPADHPAEERQLLNNKTFGRFFTLS